MFIEISASYLQPKWLSTLQQLVAAVRWFRIPYHLEEKPYMQAAWTFGLFLWTFSPTFVLELGVDKFVLLFGLDSCGKYNYCIWVPINCWTRLHRLKPWNLCGWDFIAVGVIAIYWRIGPFCFCSPRGTLVRYHSVCHALAFSHSVCGLYCWSANRNEWCQPLSQIAAKWRQCIVIGWDRSVRWYIFMNTPWIDIAVQRRVPAIVWYCRQVASVCCDWVKPQCPVLHIEIFVNTVDRYCRSACVCKLELITLYNNVHMTVPVAHRRHWQLIFVYCVENISPVANRRRHWQLIFVY